MVDLMFPCMEHFEIFSITYPSFLCKAKITLNTDGAYFAEQYSILSKNFIIS